MRETRFARHDGPGEERTKHRVHADLFCDQRAGQCEQNGDPDHLGPHRFDHHVDLGGVAGRVVRRRHLPVASRKAGRIKRVQYAPRAHDQQRREQADTEQGHRK